MRQSQDSFPCLSNPGLSTFPTIPLLLAWIISWIFSSSETHLGSAYPSAWRISGPGKEIRGSSWAGEVGFRFVGTRDFRQSWIHFCPSNPQGMSLDCVEISLGRVFASGQAYVALSRARSLQSLRVLDFDPTVVRCNPRVLRFYAALRRGRGLGLESPDDDEAGSDQENVDPNL